MYLLLMEFLQGRGILETCAPIISINPKYNKIKHKDVLLWQLRWSFHEYYTQIDTLYNDSYLVDASA